MSRKKTGKGGYGDPPREHCFKKGQSGNPKGRPKGSLNLETILRRELSRVVTVSDNGVRRSYRKSDLMVRVVTDKAVKGDLRAFLSIQKLAAGLDQRSATTSPSGDSVRDDALELADEVYQATLEALVRRMKDKEA